VGDSALGPESKPVNPWLIDLAKNQAREMENRGILPKVKEQ